MNTIWTSLAKRGFHLVPFGDRGYPYGMSQHVATDKIPTLKKWSESHPECQMAIAHGGAAGTVAIDLDIKEGVDGVAALAELEAMYGSEGDLDTFIVDTPSGGVHLIFKWHPEVCNGASAVISGIDTRGGQKQDPRKNGGITFAPGSTKPGTDSKRMYMARDLDAPLLEVPQWLVEVLNGRQPKGRARLRERYRKGERDQAIYQDVMSHVGAGYDEEQLMALVPDILSRMDEPDERMVVQKIQSALRSDVRQAVVTERERSSRVDALELNTNEKGMVIKDVVNLKKIIYSPVFEYDYGLVEFDDFYMDFTLNGKPMASRVNWATDIVAWINETTRVEWPVDKVRDHVESMAYNHRKHRNAARDYMESCVAEPGSFDDLCTNVLHLDSDDLYPDCTAEHRQLYKEFLWHWLRGVAARACIPGNKMEMMLVLFGGQGMGKSEFFRSLCPDSRWFIDTLNNGIVKDGTNNRDEIWKMHGKLIAEISEMSAIKIEGKSTDENLKKFISTTHDKMRLAYGRDMHEVPRTCSFCGTSNKMDIYRDATGSRRFLSIRIEKDIDYRAITSELRDGLWGEVMASFVSRGDMEHVMLPEGLRKKQQEINESFTYEEPGVDTVLQWMEGKTRVTWKEIHSYISVEVPEMASLQNHVAQSRLKQYLSKKYTFKKMRRHTATGSTELVRCWVNPEVEKGYDGVPPHWLEMSNDY